MKRERKRGEEKKKRISGMDSMALYGLLWISMDFWTFVWILVCSISKV